MARLVVVVLGALGVLFIAVIAVSISSYSPTYTFEICNLVPFDVVSSVHIQDSPTTWRTELALPLSPGACRESLASFSDISPTFAAYVSSDSDFVRWVADGQGVTFTKKGDAGLRCPGTRSDTTTGEARCASPVKFDSIPESHFNSARFYRMVVALDERDIPLPHQPDGEFDLEQAAVKVRELAGIWPLRRDHEARWPSDREIPYSIGVAVDDHNLMFSRGVTVTHTVSATPLGVPSPFRVGDSIVQLHGRNIWGVAELHAALIDFANDRQKGIGEKYSFQIVRGNEVMAGEWTFYFNDAYWPKTAEEAQSASNWGFGNAFTLGFSEQAYCGTQKARASWNNRPFDYPECVWSNRQAKARLKQMYTDSYEGGSLAGLVVGGLGSALAVRSLARLAPPIAGSARLTGVAIATVVGASEAAAWTLAEAAPGADITAEMKHAVRNGAGIGFLFGAVAR